MSMKVMKASKFIFSNNSNALFYVLCITLLVIFNGGLSFTLQHQSEQDGLALVKQIQQQPSLDEQALINMAANTPFMLTPSKVPVYAKYFMSIQQQHYSYNKKSVVLYSWPVWYTYSYLFLLMDALLLIIVFGVRRFRFFKSSSMVTVTSKHQQADEKVQQTANTRSTNQALQHAFAESLRKSETPVPYNMFALVQCECHFDASTDLQATLKVLVAKDFVNTAEISIKLLTAGNLAITLVGVNTIEVQRCAQHLHQSIVSIASILAPRTLKQHIKLGVCHYHFGADQVMVYQLARSALTLSEQSFVKHYHQLALNCGHAKEDTINPITQRIEKQKLVILFQPVYELDSGAIIKHQVLVKTINKSNKQLLNQESVSQFYTQAEAMLFDQAVILQVKKLLLVEDIASVISINLHSKNWLNPDFWFWLSSHVSDLKNKHTLQFEINETDFLKNQSRLKSAFAVIAALNFNIVINDVRSNKNIFKFTQNKQVSGLNLAFELVHGVEQSHLQQNYVKGIVHVSKLLSLSVFASSIETRQELQHLKSVGISGAQGEYFTNLLPDFTQVAFH